VVLGPDFFREGDIPNFGHAFSNRTHFRTRGWSWLSSVRGAGRVADEKKKRDRRQNPSKT